MLKKTSFLTIGFAVSFVLFCVYPFPIKCDQGKEKYIMKINEVKLAERLTIRYPENLSVSKRPSQEDFDIYDLEMQNAIVLSLYVGNHPRFDGIENKNARRKNINELKLICHEFKQRKKKYAKECLADLRDYLDYPQYVHFWYDVDTQEQVKTADQVIQSLSLKKDH